jgi:hypothetical protein
MKQKAPSIIHRQISAGSNSNHHIVGYEIGKIKVPGSRGYPCVDIETPGSAGVESGLSQRPREARSLAQMTPAAENGRQRANTGWRPSAHCHHENAGDGEHGNQPNQEDCGIAVTL